MKYVLILSILVLLVLTACSSVPPPPPSPVGGSDIPEGFTNSKAIDTTISNLEFEGYAIGKSHKGTFDDWSGELIFSDGQITGAKGTIQAASVNTGIDGLDAHLRSDDFFNVNQYPTITIVSTGLTEGMMTADLTFLGITKSISFPVTVTENSLSADFILDTSDFAMKYIGVKSDVRIAFTMFV